MAVRKLNLEPIVFRVGTVIVGVLIVTFLFLAATAFFGDAIATNANAPEIAEFSKSIASTNPKAYQSSSLLKEQSFRNEDLQAAVKDAEIAVSLSPNDYILWQSLARLKERSGDIATAEKALRRALALAPQYADLQWALGNVLLRQEKYDEGFRLLRSAVERNAKFAGPAASIAWDIFEGDKAKVQKAIGESNQVRSALAVYLSRLKRRDEAVELWRSIPREGRAGIFADSGRILLASLVTGKSYLKAVSVEADILGKTKPLPEAEKITNGGFEYDIPRDVSRTFDWTIASGNSPSIGVSVDEKSSGSKSLAIVFTGGAKTEFRNISQTVAVKSGNTYTFSFRYKSSLKGKQTLVWLVVDGTDENTIVSTDPIEVTSAWRTVSLSFAVPENTDGIRVALGTEKCPEPNCPIRGTVWFDDFVIE